MITSSPFSWWQVQAAQSIWRRSHQGLNRMITKTLSRRALLRGTGGAMVALPHLNLMADKPNGSDVPKRMVCVGTNFGFVPKLFFPQKPGEIMTLQS